MLSEIIGCLVVYGVYRMATSSVLPSRQEMIDEMMRVTGTQTSSLCFCKFLSDKDFIEMCMLKKKGTDKIEEQDDLYIEYLYLLYTHRLNGSPTKV